MENDKIKLENMAKIQDKITQCMKCGFCMFFCPVYREIRTEPIVARGRNVLAMELLEGAQLDWKHLEERYSQCLTCNRCAEFCPAKVEVANITFAARADIVANKGLPFTKKVVFEKLLNKRGLFGKVVRLASKLQWLLPKTKGKIRHLPTFLSALGKGRQIPEIASKFLRDQYPEVIAPPPGVQKRIRVAFFAGCATDFVFPEIGKKTIDFLTSQGVEVLFPKGQGCCGMPVFGSGDFVTAREMADRNVAVFSELEDVDYIVTSCATCGSALKEGYATYLADDKERQKRYEEFNAKVKDINEFITDVLKPSSEAFSTTLPQGTKVTYHDPCHLVRYQKISSQPRKIIKSIPGLELVEMREPDRCCGMGGSFNVQYYELSKKIAEHKMNAIADTEADIVVTACPGCMIQLIDNTTQMGMPQRVVHVMELLC
ncbi:MAG: (Fe-S)-binding protein [Deltaproteobacteria bacterium]|nr:MAG: (Fe-S)-binding protein [Deltaproteobacteria bacterium]